MTAQTVTWHCLPTTVLVGVDFGDASAHALAIANVVAAGFNARLRVLHADRFEPPPYFTVDQIARLEAERHAAQTAAVVHVTQFANATSAYAADALVANEPPVDALLREAVTTDLIVLGTHGRRGPGRWWLGAPSSSRASPEAVLPGAGPLVTPQRCRASLVIMPTPVDRASWIFSDSVARILGECDRCCSFRAYA